MADEFGELGEGELQETVNGILAFLRELRDRPLPQTSASGTPFSPDLGEQRGRGDLRPSNPFGAEEDNLERLAKRLGGIPFTEVPEPPGLPPMPDPLGPDVDIEEIPEPEQAQVQAKPAMEEPEDIQPSQRARQPQQEEPTSGMAATPELSANLAEVWSLVNGLIDRERELAGLDLPDDVAESTEGGQIPAGSLGGLSARLAQLEVLVHRAAVPKPMLLPDVTETIFPARITSSTIANGTATGHATDPSTKWTYPFSEVEKTAAGYGGWSVLTGGRSGTAHNVIEDINTTTGADRMGNGVVLDNLDYDDDATFEFAPRPVPANVIVQMRVVEFRVSGVPTVEYWFAYENGADGVCD